MPKLSTAQLEEIATKVRKDTLKMLYEARSGHTAGSLGLVEVFVSLYFSIMQHDPTNPDWEERDRLFLSNGHTCPALYTTMAHANYFDKSLLKTYSKLGSKLQGHPEKSRLPGIEITSGPLGSGLSEAVGYAFAARHDDKRFRNYCITSDAEHDEGNHWEGVAVASKYSLSNLTVFVDRNNIQIDGFTEDIMPLDPLAEKYRAFNWNVFEIDGHNFEAIIGAVQNARSEYQRPTAIICKTIAGKGVSFMEGRYEWHGKVPNKEELQLALKELSEKNI
ncbi:transketolase [Candidatus Woesebacteria bacterium RBG_16_36_11]|uniref:Transketolase n=3 Tax=Candidatus Woeseibacteriota TaxID=1752722 RepID=A0A1F7X858_9BACT|nr:MAG: transketolase [Candidatus Woesebacteria bacterium RBG_13_36_22]OGM11113.1 MAG: transketolase [Candidatus Woesebacteria bacterium RBG_16_36_11]OGM16599.1 MAG: transketolase [Candidatus Woesebacteria bacterium RBG_19FT_COMBO_37_29]